LDEVERVFVGVQSTFLNATGNEANQLTDQANLRVFAKLRRRANRFPAKIESIWTSISSGRTANRTFVIEALCRRIISQRTIGVA
jgi:hypothetical protein